MASLAGSGGARALDLVLLGPPGAGKGTQARRIASHYRIPHVASGDLLRAHRQQGTQLGKEAQAYMERGELAPDQLVIDMVLDRLDEPDAACGVLLDGFPRTVAQATALDAALQRDRRATRAALYLKVPEQELIQRASDRWTCRGCQATYSYEKNPPREPGVCSVCGGELYQREDDRPEVVAERIRVYLRDTLPIITYYRDRGLLHEIDGTRAIDSVTADLQRSIDQVRD